MSQLFEQTWEIYTSSWKAASADDKRELFEKSLDTVCQYTDPLAKANGWDELLQYMQDFHRQVPGGYFLTTYFMAHHNKSIAKWVMRNGDNISLSDGISFGEYNEAGKLVKMTGFFEPLK